MSNLIEVDDKKLLNVKEVCEYLGIGDSKCREILRGRNGIGVQIGNRWYANKSKLDKSLCVRIIVSER